MGGVARSGVRVVQESDGTANRWTGGVRHRLPALGGNRWTGGLRDRSWGGGGARRTGGVRRRWSDAARWVASEPGVLLPNPHHLPDPHRWGVVSRSESTASLAICSSGRPGRLDPSRRSPSSRGSAVSHGMRLQAPRVHEAPGPGHRPEHPSIPRSALLTARHNPSQPRILPAHGRRRGHKAPWLICWR